MWILIMIIVEQSKEIKRNTKIKKEEANVLLLVYDYNNLRE